MDFEVDNSNSVKLQAILAACIAPALLLDRSQNHLEIDRNWIEVPLESLELQDLVLFQESTDFSRTFSCIGILYKSIKNLITYIFRAN